MTGGELERPLLVSVAAAEPRAAKLQDGLMLRIFTPLCPGMSPPETSLTTNPRLAVARIFASMAQVLDEPPVAAEMVQINPAATPAATPLPGGVPPLSSLKDEYSALYSTYSHFCDKPRGSPGDGTNLPYFDAEELAKLSPQNPPVDHFLASNNVEHGEFVTSFCCCNGEPSGPVKIPKDVEAAPGSQPLSLAETVYGFADDGLHHGVSSCDELLHEDSSGGELMKFFNTFNSKPLWKMTVSGSHSVRTVHHGTDDDNNPTTTERYSTREDFKHEVDVSYVCDIGEERSPR